MESVEAVGFVHPELNAFAAKSPRLQFFTAGDKGVVRIWDLTQGSIIYSLATEAGSNAVDQEAERQIIDAL